VVALRHSGATDTPTHSSFILDGEEFLVNASYGASLHYLPVRLTLGRGTFELLDAFEKEHTRSRYLLLTSRSPDELKSNEKSPHVFVVDVVQVALPKCAGQGCGVRWDPALRL